MGLNDVYTNVRGAILMLVPLPSLAQSLATLVQEEKQREMQNITQFQEGSAAISAVGNKFHSQGSKESSADRKPLYCTNCKKTNHMVEKCFFLHGFPAQYRDRNKKKTVDGKFAGSAQTGTSSTLGELTSEQFARLMSLLEAPTRKGKADQQDDFVGFAGSFYEDTIGDW